MSNSAPGKWNGNRQRIRNAPSRRSMRRQSQKPTRSSGLRNHQDIKRAGCEEATAAVELPGDRVETEREACASRCSVKLTAIAAAAIKITATPRVETSGPTATRSTYRASHAEGSQTIPSG